jgi:monooxygenase
MTCEHFDVLIIGAGLSGIGAACHLQKHCPGKRYAILEGRERIGGTWDLFRYPGIRSDSDMFTLGYAFRPWRQAKAIADGPAILHYVQETAKDFGVEQHIRFGHQVKKAVWSSQEACWTLDIVQGQAQESVRMRCNFLFVCSGYYSYESGYTPQFKDMQCFEGKLVHPQQWTEDIAYAGKRVVVIGSGATAVTLVPELAKQAAQVTMLQRSPTYVIAWPSEDALANGLRRVLPPMLAYKIARWKQVLLNMYVFNLSKKRPAVLKRVLIARVKAALGADYDVGQHFTPRYNPWEQRLCLVPDGDLFKAIQSARASVVTDEIAYFTAQGIALVSGKHLDADLVVTATGLNLQLLGGMQFEVDGKSVDLPDCLNYKGLMYSGMPNMAFSFGYTNASWTLRCDLTCAYVCRLLNHMEKNGIAHCTPRNTDPSMAVEPWVDFSSGYFARSIHLFPKQGAKAPWKLYQNYLKDIWLLRYGKLDDGVMVFSHPPG